jgi:hypothetical protein
MKLEPGSYCDTRAKAIGSWVKLVSELQQAYDQLGQKKKLKKAASHKLQA